MAYDGSKIVPVRIPAALLQQIQSAIARVEYTRDEGPHTMSTWIRAACEQVLAHQQRAKRCRRDKRGGGSNG